MSPSSNPLPSILKAASFECEIANHAEQMSSRGFYTNSSKGEKLEFVCQTQPSLDFCTFIETTPKSEIVGFFRKIATNLEDEQKILDFHMQIVNADKGFKVEVFYGVKKLGPPLVSLSDCISCHPNALLFPGMEPKIEAKECVLEEFAGNPSAACRLDAKGRCGFIITPIRHVDRMSELNDEELFELWSLAVLALRRSNLPFTVMILNHGAYRNVEHLHLKVWVDKDLYEQYCTQWSKERQELWRQLQDLGLRRRRKRLAQRKNNHGLVC